MQEKLICKVGYYSIYEVKIGRKTKYKADSGKTINLKSKNKVILNKNRDVSVFDSLEEAKKYTKKKVDASLKKKSKALKKLPKSLYLILIREEQSKEIFVKVGITSKRFILRRFSKAYGYEGYEIMTILRRIDSNNSEKMESNIKDKLNKERSIKKYRPILESFSGYSECYNSNELEKIIKIFDDEVLKNG